MMTDHGCPFCGREDALRLEGGDEASEALPRVVCDWCLAQGPHGADAERAREMFHRRAGAGAELVVALAIMLASLGMVAVVVAAEHGARRGMVRELEEAQALTEAVEARAWERGWEAGKMAMGTDETDETDETD